jgi:hypothetical protein
MFQKKVVVRIKLRNLYSVIFLFFGKRTVYEIMWKNILELGRPPMKTWRVCIACWIPKATNTHTLVV